MREHTIMTETFPVWSVSEDMLSLRENLEMAVRRVGGCCEMADGLGGREPGNRANVLC
jgi:uncharacterized protein YkvS